MQYEYLIAYAHDRGFGRFFVSRNAPITSREDIEAIEAAHREQHHAVIAIQSFVLLRTWQDDTTTNDGRTS